MARTVMGFDVFSEYDIACNATFLKLIDPMTGESLNGVVACGEHQTDVEIYVAKHLTKLIERKKQDGLSGKSNSQSTRGSVGQPSSGGGDSAGQRTAQNYQQYQRGSPFLGPDKPAAPAKPLKVEKILVGEIIAYRAWRVNSRGLLTSISQSAIWGPGEVMEAKKVPSNPEGGGVYAFKSKRGLYDFVNCNCVGSDSLVLGQVQLWGDVVEHELGYRAEWAAIVKVLDGPGLEELRERYQLAV